MNVEAWKRRNLHHLLANRLRHPWPLWKRAGGIHAVVFRADGTREDLGRISDTYIRREGWSVGTK
jgi:hypothetical protein